MRAGILTYNPKIQLILLFHRFKEHRDYYVIPGGGQNPGETALATAQREIAEEIGWQVKQEELSPDFTIDNQGRQEVYFLYKTDRTDTPTIQGEEKSEKTETTATCLAGYPSMNSLVSIYNLKNYWRKLPLLI